MRNAHVTTGTFIAISAAVFRILIAAAILFAAARPSVASCITDGQGPCYRYWNVEAVFVAKVIEMTPFRIERLDPGVVYLGGDYRLRVIVVEAFRGVEGGATVTLFAPDGVCGGINAENGGELFVYALRNKSGELWAQGCGVSGPLERAAADLAYARSVHAQGPAAVFYGDVVQREDLTGGPADFSPMAGVRIRVRGVNFEAETETDDKGNYSLTLPGAGKYTAETMPPPGLANRFGDRPIAFELADRRACYRGDFQLQLNGRIRGRVVNDQGEPVSHLIVRDGAGKRSAKTDATGAFEIGPIEEGMYSISMISGSRSPRFADAGLAAVLAGRITHLAPVTLPAGLELVMLSVTVTMPAEADDAVLVLTAKGGAEQHEEPIRSGSESIQFLVEKNESFELMAATPTHEAKAVARTSAPLTEVTLTLRPRPAPH